MKLSPKIPLAFVFLLSFPACETANVYDEPPYATRTYGEGEVPLQEEQHMAEHEMGMEMEEERRQPIARIERRTQRAFQDMQRK